MKAENRRTPKLRFPEFTEEWEQYQVTELGEIYIGLVTTMTSHYAEHGVLLIRNSDVKDGRLEFSDKPIYLDDEFAEQNASRRHKVGDVITVHTGDIGTSAVITEKEAGSLGFATIVTRPDRERIIPEYLCTFLNSSTHKNFAMNVSTGDGRNNYNLKDYYECMVPVPCLAEQRKIAGLVIGLNKYILHLQQKTEWMKAYKQGILRKVFPRDGENRPEIRFPGFTNVWEQRKLGEFATIVTGKLDANAMKENGSFDFYTSGIQKYKIDVPAFEGPAITIAGNGATVGYMHLADGKFNAYQRTYVLSAFQANREFLFFEIGNKLPKKITQEARAGNIPYIVMDMLTDLVISVPPEREQKKIGEFMMNIDNLITLHQRRLDYLKEYKKGLLQQMFV